MSRIGLITSHAQANTSIPTEEELSRIASEAFIFGYPLVLTDLTKRRMTNFPRVCAQGAPINQFLHHSEFTELRTTRVSPLNPDMTCSTAWLDLTDEPIILSVPDMGKRYHILHMIDAWTNTFLSLGTRTMGNAKAYFAITGPQWTGSVPLGLRHVKCPTNLALIVGWTQIYGEGDCPFVRKLQTHYKLAPISAWDKTYFPPDSSPVDPEIDMTSSSAAQLAGMDATEFFVRLASLLSGNAAAQADTSMISKLAQIGVVAGSAFPPEWMGLRNRQAIQDGADRGRETLESARRNPGIFFVNGWGFNTNTGRYGSDYLRRAAVARSGLGVIVPEDALYLRTMVDAEGENLTGEKAYVLRFNAKQFPPVRAFWSLSMYDHNDHLVHNDPQRFSLTSHDPLVVNPDGSIDIYIQTEALNGKLRANWFPTPSGEFNLILRLYWPKSEVWGGKWLLPAVRSVHSSVAVAA